MKQNWILVAAIVTVLAVPFGLAAFEDATKDSAQDRYRRAKEAGDDEGAIRALADMSAEEADRIAEERLREDEADVVEWDRAEPLDLGFIDRYLAAKAPGLAGALADAMQLDRPLSEDARDFGDDSDDLSFGFHVLGEPYSDEAALVAVEISFESDRRVEEKLFQKYGAASGRGGLDGVRVWFDVATRTKLVFDNDEDSLASIIVSRYGDLARVLDLVTADALIGQTAPALAGRFGAALSEVEDEGLRLRLLAPSASAKPVVDVGLTVDDEEAVVRLSMTIDLSLESDAVKEARAEIERRFGAPLLERLGDMTELRFAAHPTLVVYEYDDRLVIERGE